MNTVSAATLNQGQAARSGTPGFVEIGGGHRLFVRDWGDGPSIVFLAGWGMESAAWAATMCALNQEGFRTIAYDRRGHGHSTDPGVIDYDCLADDLARVLERLDMREATIVTHSGAAGEAIRYVGRHGATRLSRLILLAPVGPCMHQREDNPEGFPKEAIAAVLQQIATDLPGWIDDNAELFAPGASRRTLDWIAGTVMNASLRALLDFQRAIAETDFRAEAASLRLPVSIIHGDRDYSAPLALTARRYAQLIPNAELIIYPAAAHGLMVTHAQPLAADIARSVRPPAFRK
ncbi:MAG TPA: alpha/beta hydrolase [Rhodopila sp.]|nr:alpha/beta hydrolase [Rhodopila sp.]